MRDGETEEEAEREDDRPQQQRRFVLDVVRHRVASDPSIARDPPRSSR
jgi:hypothetical protein